MRNWLLVIFLSFLIVNASFAQGIGDVALRRGFSVRASGMGGAFTAIADDGSAVFYNPAGLAEPGFTYFFGNPDTNQRNVNGSFELAKIGYAGYGSWRMSNASGETVSTTAMAFGNSAGWLNCGLTYKGINWTVSGVSNSGWTIDLGWLARITPSFKVGLLTQDVLTSQTALETASGRLVFAYKLFDDSVLVAGDMEIDNNFQNFGHLGIEATIVKGLAVRGGVDRADTTLGATLDMSFFSFDYAAVFSQNGQATQKFEAGIKFLPRRERPFSVIKPIEYALIDVSGSIKGGRTEFSFLGGLRPGLDSILSDIRAATKDKAIDGIMLRLGGFSGGLGGMAVVQEIRDELKRARKNGKKIIAYVEGSAVEDEYYLAAIADKIVAPPGAAIGGLGKSLAIYRLKGLYEKFGVAWQIFKQGKYKDAFDPYARDEMSPEQAEALEGLEIG